jgi:hypothetical protein
MRPEVTFFFVGWAVGVVVTWVLSQVIYTFTEYRGR